MRTPALVLVLSLAACGTTGTTPAPTTAGVPRAAAGAKVQTPPAMPDHTIARSAVRAVVDQGLGYFLQRVELDDHPVMTAGKFHGFRIANLRDPDFWAGVDLKPGDVVTGVNGFPIERPEQAQTAFDSLQVASELKVAYDRDGQPRELVYAIDDAR
ncbi:MAG TPA: serine protease [Polyangiaceae bacterium]